MLHMIKNNKVVLFVKSKYNRALDVSNFKVRYNDRNDIKVIIPFLSGIGAEFNMIDSCVMVKDSPAGATKLKELNFEQLGEVIDRHSLDRNDGIFRNIIKGATRCYNYDYNIEIYIIQPCFWKAVNSASIISHNLVSGKPVTDTFLSVYSSLLLIEKQG